jgi:site-specific DNA-methyltransferase (adenine-specific)
MSSTLALPEYSVTTHNAVHHMDALALLNALPSGSVDMALLDLPYGTTACAWDEIIPFAPMWAGLKRVCKRGAAMVFTASQPFTTKLIASNMDMFRYEWIWEKSLPTGHLDANKRPLKKHENILVFSSGAITYYPMLTERISHGGSLRPAAGIYGKFQSDVKRVIDEDKGFPTSMLKFNTAYHDREAGLHPTQKPVALFEYLIRTYTQPDDLVLDFVCGSGTTAVAAQNTGRRFICGDQSLAYVNIARHRLATSTLPLPMFEAS